MVSKMTVTHKNNFEVYKGRHGICLRTWLKSLENFFLFSEGIYFFCRFGEINGHNEYWVADATGTGEI